MSRDRRLVGVDGGGTSTTAWLADGEGKVLGRGSAGPSNLKAVGAERAEAALNAAISSAFREAGLDPAPVTAACLGLAGFDSPEDRAWLDAWSGRCLPAERLILVNDGDLVLAAGTPEGLGVAVIAGTGSIAVGKGPGGRATRSGGWGYVFGDEGSAYNVAVAGLRKVARRVDGRDRRRADRDPLAERLCQALGVGDPSGLVSAVYRNGFDRARIASLAPAVTAAAEEDETVRLEILAPAGVDLADMALAVARSLDWPRGPLPVALAGSFVLNTPEVARILLATIAEAGYEPQPSAVHDPARGAIVLALRELER
jgi:N-acetylglucosamine kinase-like BadF-type ATPase